LEYGFRTRASFMLGATTLRWAIALRRIALEIWPKKVSST